MHQNSEQHSNTFSSQRADIPATMSAPQQFVSTSPIQSQRSRNTTLNMTTPHSYSSVETWKCLSDYFFGAIVPQWRSLQLNPEYCNTKLPSTLLKDMLKLCSMLMDATETTMEKGAPVSTQTEECLQSVDADSHEKTEVTGAKEGIVTEISVDNCEASACLQHVDTQSQTTATAEPRKSCMKKKSTADTKDLDKIEPCAMKKPAMPAAYESDVDNRKETEAKGAKDSILKEISVDNCGDNKKTDTPELETEAGKCLQHVDTQSQTTAEPKKSCMKKEPPADTKDWDKIEACPVEKPVIPAVHESEVDSSSVISLASDDLSAEKTYVYAVIQLVVSRALKKVSSKHKDSTWILTPKSNCHRLLEKIWPEIEGKHLDLSPKRLTSIEKAIFTNLCKAHKCKEKHLISSLKEELEDDITVPTFTKHLLALPKRVLTLSKNRDEYRELVEHFARDLVMHAMSNTNEAGKLPLGADEAIKERLAQKVWDKIVSQKLKISLEDIEEVSVTVYNELREKWKYPNTVMQLMKIGHRNVDKEIVKSFIRNAPLKRPNIFSRMFSCACFT
ncbi:E3 ubiquitin-protein ligase [Sarotherodon galilaeus]